MRKMILSLELMCYRVFMDVFMFCCLGDGYGYDRLGERNELF